MNGTKTRKLLAMVLCLLLCVTAVGAFADADTPPVTVKETSEPAATAASAPVEPAKEETTSPAPETPTRTPDPEPSATTPDPKPNTTTDNTPTEPEPEPEPERTPSATVDEPIPAPEPEQTPSASVDEPTPEPEATGTPAPLEMPEEEMPGETPEPPLAVEPTDPEDQEEETELPDETSELPDEQAGDLAETQINPVIRLSVRIDGDVLTEGTRVTILADIDGIPAGIGYDVQWQNDLDGEFRDVPGETGTYVTFIANERNVNCHWRLELTLHDGAITA